MPVSDLDHRLDDTASRTLVQFQLKSKTMLMALEIVSIILLVLILLVVWMLITPVRLLIDTRSNQYSVSQLGTIRLSYQLQATPSFEIRVFGIRIPQPVAKPAKTSAVRRPRTSSVRPRSLETWLLLLRGCIRSVKLTTLRLDVDTDDVVMNAKLVPLAMMVSGGVVQVWTNYVGRRYLLLTAECRVYKLIWPLIKFLTNK